MLRKFFCPGVRFDLLFADEKKELLKVGWGQTSY